MILVVVAVEPLRPTVCRFGIELDVRAERRHRVVVALVVHRVGARHPDRDAVDDVGRVDQADLPELALRELDERVVGQRPGLVALEAEVLGAEARVAGRVMPGLQAPKFCTRPARVPGIVEVDPVVGERLGVGRDQPDDERSR